MVQKNIMKKINYLYVLVIMFVVSGCAAPGKIAPEQLKQASEQNAKLGVGYMRQGRYEVALNKLRKSIDQDPDNADAHHYIAELYRRLGRPDDADKHFKKALDILPDDTLSSHVAGVRNNYAVYLCEQKKYSEAKIYFGKVLEDPLYQERGQLYENMGQCELYKGDLHQAENYFLKALKENPDLTNSLLAMAQLNFDQGLNTQTEIYLNKFLAKSEHDAQSLWLAILIERNKGNKADKDKIANYSVRLKGKYPDSKQTLLLKRLESKGQ